MFEKNNKKRLYWLMDEFLLRRIDARTFCNEYYYCYDLELDSDLLDNKEKKAFAELSIVVNRFSEFEEDLLKYPGTYFTEKQLREKMNTTIIFLSKSNSSFC